MANLLSASSWDSDNLLILVMVVEIIEIFCVNEIFRIREISCGQVSFCVIGMRNDED